MVLRARLLEGVVASFKKQRNCGEIKLCVRGRVTKLNWVTERVHVHIDDRQLAE